MYIFIYVYLLLYLVIYNKNKVIFNMKKSQLSDEEKLNHLTNKHITNIIN